MMAAPAHEHALVGLRNPAAFTAPTLHHLIVRPRPSMFFWPLMLWWAIGVHIVWGLVLIFAPEQANVAVLGGLNPWLDLGLPAQELGVFTIGFAGMAALAVMNEHKYPRWRLASLLTPQYVMLVVAMASDILILTSGEYRGRPIPRMTLIAALWPLFLAQLLHTISIIERLLYRWTPPLQ